MLVKFRELMSDYYLLDPDKQLLVAVSGGADSVVLLDLISQLPVNQRPQVHIAHLNHHLRTESDQEERFVRGLADLYGYPIHVGHWEKDEQPSSGIEKAARRKRYNFFAQLMREQKLSYLMTGHHLDDQVETILMRLTRGASLEQLLGIKEEQSFSLVNENTSLIRPLLGFSKEEIYAYADNHGLDYVEDQSNKSSDYTRNRFRNQIIPLLKNENRQFKQHLSQFRSDLKDLIELAQEPIDRAYDEAVQLKEDQIILDLKKMNRYSLALQKSVITQILQELYSGHAQQYKTNYIELIQYWLVDGEVNSSLDLTANYCVEKKYQQAVFKPQSSPKESISKKTAIQLDSMNQWVQLSDTEKIGLFTEDFEWNEMPNQITEELKISEEELQMPLIIRHRQAGDRMTYQGLSGRKKIKDIFIDDKRPLAERDQAWLVEDQDQRIIWLIGHRKMDLFTASETDKLFYSLKYIKKQS